MRRRPGISGLQRDAATRGVYKAVGEQVQTTRNEAMKAQLATFKKSLEEFAMNHRADIRRDPMFRAQFHAMCANIGVDPLACNKGVWAQLLGFGDFYYQLGVQITEACLAGRSMNGGLLDLRSLQRQVQRRRGSVAEPISEDDLIRAISKLKVLGGGLGLVDIGATTYVRSVPGELNTDKNRVIEVAQGVGYVSVDGVVGRTGWTEVRAKDVLHELLREGLCLLDTGDPSGRDLYWFPCVEAAGGTV